MLQNILKNSKNMILLDRTTTGVILSTFGLKIPEWFNLINWNSVLTNAFLVVSIILASVNIYYKIRNKGK